MFLLKKLLKDWTFKWWEVGLLKLALTAFGAAIALQWHDFFIDYKWALLGIFILIWIYFIYKTFNEL